MIKNIIFDFDGVILDSVPIKTEAYRKLFQEFPANKVQKLIRYHIHNGGISRYAKIKYFYENILFQSIIEDEIINYAKQYSELTKEELIKPQYLIKETVEFIKKNYSKYSMHIASGADENDLNYICKEQKLTKYFKSIYGSPTKKSEIVKNILNSNNYDKHNTILIGDSVNDYEAASHNSIDFYAFNNTLLQKNHKYINTFLEFQ